MVALDSLCGYENNARTHSPAQIEQIAASIREFGWTVPIIADENYGVVAGHGRIEAAKLLGMDKVEVIRKSGWTEDQKRAYVIADNKLALNAGWDTDILLGELDLLTTSGFDMSLTGFDQWETADLLKDVEAPPAKRTRAGKEVSDLPEPGSMWRIGRHLLCVGDASDPGTMRAALDAFGEKPRYVVTDPPWDLSPEIVSSVMASSGAGEALVECAFKQAAWLEHNGPAHGWRVIVDLVAVNRGGGAGFVPTTRLPIKAHLYMLLMRLEDGKGSWKQPKRGFRSVLGLDDAFYESNGEGYRKDPRIFVEAMNGWRDKGSVIDPFAGHGTTAMACSSLFSPRRALLVERDPSQARECILRLAETLGQAQRVE